MANQKLMHSTFWYTVGSLIVRFFNFLLLPIYSNLIPTDDFGKYSLLISITVVASAFYQLGLPSGLSKFYIEENEDAKRKKIFSTSINLLVVNSIIISAFAIIFANDISAWLFTTDAYADIVVLLFLVLLVDTLSTQILQLLKTLEEAKKVVVYSALGSAINILLNVVFVVYYQLGIWGIVISQIISSAALLIFLMPILTRHYWFLIDKHLAKRMLMFSIPILIAGIFNYGIDVIDRFILNFYFGEKEVGIYSFAYRIALVMNLFVISFRTAWIPHSLNLFQLKNYENSFGRSFSKLLGAGLTIVVIGTLLSNDLFNLVYKNNYLFNPSYSDGAPIIPLILLAYLFNGIATFYFVYPLTENRSIHFIYSDGLGLIVNVFSNLILIPAIGMLGAGVSAVVSYMVVAAYLFWISKNQIKVDYQKDQILRITALALATTGIGLLLNIFYIDLILITVFLVLASRILDVNVFAFLKSMR